MPYILPAFLLALLPSTWRKKNILCADPSPVLPFHAVASALTVPAVLGLFCPYFLLVFAACGMHS